jgi:hypothetical protein
MDNDVKWFLSWSDTQRIVFFTAKFVVFHVGIGSTQHNSIIFFGLINLLAESHSVEQCKRL